MSTYRPEPSYKISFRYRRLLVPVDGSEPSMLALEFALDMAQRYGSKITVLHAYPIGEEKSLKDVRDKVQARATRYNANLDVRAIPYDPATSSAASAIVKEALEGGYDAVILGARGRSSSEEVMIGSVALAVVTHVPSNIILVR